MNPCTVKSLVAEMEPANEGGCPLHLCMSPDESPNPGEVGETVTLANKTLYLKLA